MDGNATTAICITDSAMRSAVEQHCRALTESVYVLNAPAPDAAAVLKLRPSVFLADMPTLESLAVGERRTLKQAGVQLLLLIPRGGTKGLAENPAAADAADLIEYPLDDEIFRHQFAQAHELARLKGEVASLSARSTGDQSKFDSALAGRTAERNKAENEAFVLERRMADLNKLKSNLITVISHEFKTPLHLAAGYIALLGDASLGALNDEQKNAVETVKRQLARLSGKLADIERIAQLEMGLPQELTEPVDIGVILKGEVEGFQKGARDKGVRLNVRVDSGLPAVNGNSDFLSDVFRRLIDNAIHYNRKDGTVNIVAQRGQNTDGTPGVMATVADSGQGIPPALVPHIFERFGEFRDIEHHSSRRSGLGLGLAICRHLVELHGGTISVHSVQGQGSTFTVFLPSGKKRGNTGEWHI